MRPFEVSLRKSLIKQPLLNKTFHKVSLRSSHEIWQETRCAISALHKAIWLSCLRGKMRTLQPIDATKYFSNFTHFLSSKMWALQPIHAAHYFLRFSEIFDNRFFDMHLTYFNKTIVFCNAHGTYQFHV